FTNHHVFGLYIAMQNTSRVRFAQRARNLTHNVTHTRQRQWSARSDQVAQRNALNVLHRVIKHPQLRLTVVEDRDGVRMSKTAGVTGFAFEALGQLWHVRIQTDDLDRRRASEERMMSQIYGPHTAFAQLAPEAIVTQTLGRQHLTAQVRHHAAQCDQASAEQCHQHAEAQYEPSGAPSWRLPSPLNRPATVQVVEITRVLKKLSHALPIPARSHSRRVLEEDVLFGRRSVAQHELHTVEEQFLDRTGDHYLRLKDCSPYTDDLLSIDVFRRSPQRRVDGHRIFALGIFDQTKPRGQGDSPRRHRALEHDTTRLIEGHVESDNRRLVRGHEKDGIIFVPSR